MSAIREAIAEAGVEGVVALEPGIYSLADGPLVIAERNLTLRSATGDPNDVIFEGGEAGADMIQILSSGVRIAGIGLRNSPEIGIRVGGNTSANLEDITLTNLDVLDVRIGVQTVVDPIEGQFVDGSVVSCSTFRRSDDVVGGGLCTGVRDRGVLGQRLGRPRQRVLGFLLRQ